MGPAVSLVVDVNCVIGIGWMDGSKRRTPVTFLLLASSTKNLYTTSIQDVVCDATMPIVLHMASST